MEKEKRYAEIPIYNQETQYVIEKEPVDMGDYIWIDLEVKEMPIDEETEFEYWSLYWAYKNHRTATRDYNYVSKRKCTVGKWFKGDVRRNDLGHKRKI